MCLLLPRVENQESPITQSDFWQSARPALRVPVRQRLQTLFVLRNLFRNRCYVLFSQIILWWTTAPVWERAPATRWRWRTTALRCASLVPTSAPKVKKTKKKTCRITSYNGNDIQSYSPVCWVKFKYFFVSRSCRNGPKSNNMRGKTEPKSI